MEHLKTTIERAKHAFESNKGKQIKVGDRVVDIFCLRGTVIKIHKPKRVTVTNHGFINVSLDNGDMEHYVYYQWQNMLKILK